jgi:hypothetical protein
VAGVGTPRLEPVAEPVAAADGGGRVSSKEPLIDSSILVRTGQQIAGPGLLARLRHLCTIGDIMETLMCKCFE